MSRGQSLHSLIALYRRTPADPALLGAEVELEARFRGVDRRIFATVLAALNAKELEVGDGEVTLSVSSVMAETLPPRQKRRPRAGGHALGTSLIRQIFFDAASAEGGKIGERYYRKWPLAPPHRVRNPHALDYNVVLSAEEPLDGPFVSDAGALIRVKSRASFTRTLPPRAAAGGPGGAEAGGGRAPFGDDGGPPPAAARGSAWRIDLTVTRTLCGADAQKELRGAVQEMFRAGPVSAENMLDRLDPAGPGPGPRAPYDYEIEVEHLPPAKEGGRPALRGAGLGPGLAEAFLAVIGEVLRLAHPEHVQEAKYQAEIRHVAGFVVDAPGLLRRYERDWGLKKLVAPVAALTRGEYRALYPPTQLYLLDKADGVRAIASARDGRLLVLAEKLREFPPPAAPPLPPDGLAGGGRPTIVDGELVGGAGGGPPVFFAFDVIALGGENVSRRGYEDRVARLGAAVEALRPYGLDVRPKPVVRLTASAPAELRKQFLSPAFEDPPYRTDGRILVEGGEAYQKTRAHKWKALWDTTIDFLARRPPPAALGPPPYADEPGHELHFLFVGISAQLLAALGLEPVRGYGALFGGGGGGARSYAPIQFAPSDAPLAFLYQHPVERPRAASASAAAAGWEGWTRHIDGKVVELRCAGRRGECAAAGALGLAAWQLVRVREDRARELATQAYFGNDFRVAELTWLNYVDPLTERQLWEGPAAGYFASPKGGMYRPQTAFTSFVKSRRIAALLPHAAWVVDAAVGKGQDFGRYLRASVRHVVGIDRDRGALSELVRRKYSHAAAAARRRPARGGRGPGPTTLYALRADLTAPHAEIARKVRAIAGFPGGPEGGGGAGADALVINLALHYLAGSLDHLRNFVVLCRALVKVGGHVVITTMVGGRVHALLSDQGVPLGGSWDSRQDGALKYSIRRGYAAAGLTPAGQQIGVLLPFSGEGYYEEFLVNVDAVVAEFAARGFAVSALTSFDSLFGEFRARNPAVYRRLTEADFTYLSLYGEIVLRREK
jgi:hypothetical protein